MNKRIILSNLNMPLLIVMSLLLIVGLANLYSATVPRDGSAQIFLTQIYWFLIGTLLLFSMLFIDYRSLDRFAYIIYFFALVLLILVAVNGKTSMGGRRWLYLGSLSIQPSEFMKIALILALSKYLSSSEQDKPKGFSQLWIAFLMFLVPAVLVLKQPDLGTAIIICAISFSLIIISNVKWHVLLSVSLTGIVLFIFSFRFLLKNYQKKRIESFINPEADLLGSGYHANQSMIAVGSGRGTGKGFMGSTQSQFSFLPEQHTDFIFSVFAEEWGFAGVFLTFGLFFFLMALILDVSKNAKDKFGVFVSIGVFFLVFWHFIINIGMIAGLLPVVGVTLPFFSAGGSSLISQFIGMGLVFNISMRRFSF